MRGRTDDVCGCLFTRIHIHLPEGRARGIEIFSTGLVIVAEPRDIIASVFFEFITERSENGAAEVC